MRKPNVTLDKPIQIGFATLEISKVIVYELLYILKEYYKNYTFNILYTDTDSLKICLIGGDIYKINEIKKYFDTSNYSKNTDKPLTAELNEKVLGLFKIENAYNPIVEFIAPASKIYLEIYLSDKIGLKAKGLKQGFKKNVTTEKCKNTAIKEEPHQIKQTQIVSDKLVMKIEEVEK